MLSADEIYRQLTELDEHPQLEAKTCIHSLGASVMETVCAFSNEPGMGGGHILLGVGKVKKSLFENTFDIFDIPDVDKLQTDLATQCAEAFNHRVWPQMRVEFLFKKRVLTVFIPELAASQKPLHFKHLSLPQGAFRRSGSADVQCRDEDIDVFYQDRKRESFDESIVDGATLLDIESAELNTYRELRKSNYPDAEELGYGDNELLIALGCAKPKDGELRPTVAGILLFGTSAAIRRWFPFTRIDYLRVPGRTWIKDPDDRYKSLEIRAPLIRAIQRAIAAIRDDILKDFSLAEGDLQRKDIPPIPDKVMREAVVNAVMHRCYNIHEPVQIIRFANRLEIRNAGYSLKAPELYSQPGSRVRNPKIAAVLHELNIAETKGSGIRVMQKKMREANLSPPYFESDRHANKFMAVLVLQHFMRPEVIEWLTHFRDLSLTNDEAHALFFVREIGAINSLAFCMLTDADAASACASLHRLCRAVLLTPQVNDGHRWYSPTKYLMNPSKYTAAARKRLAASGKIPDRGVEIPTGGVELTGRGVELPNAGVEFIASGVESAGAESDDCEEFAELPLEILEQLPPNRGKGKPEMVRIAILILCEWRPLYAEEIAVYLQRKKQPKLVEEYLSPMVAEGLIERTIPGKPTSPAQKYKIASLGSQKLLARKL